MALRLLPGQSSVAIVGAGHAGFALAALLSDKGVKVRADSELLNARLTEVAGRHLRAS